MHGNPILTGITFPVGWRKGIIRLRQGYFIFFEYKSKPDYFLYFVNRIYQPSYISLHTALAFYEVIPEVVVQIVSISSLKTASFSNCIGEYSYHSVKENLMFGYEFKPMADNRTIQFATSEKALLDLLYFYPFYNSEQELEELRWMNIIWITIWTKICWWIIAINSKVELFFIG